MQFFLSQQFFVCSQGAILQSSDRGGIRIQYSKNPFGKKRDHQGNPVDPSTLPPAGAALPQMGEVSNKSCHNGTKLESFSI